MRSAVWPDVMRRTHRSSWMVSGWLMPAALSADGGGTACMTLGCPDDFIAVRLGFANVSRKPWQLTQVIGCASAGFGNYISPTTASPWIGFTTRNNGQDAGGIVSNHGPGPAITVHGLDDALLEQDAGVAWTWTDWMALPSLSADSVTNLRVLMLRALVPGNQTITFANGQLRNFVAEKAINLGIEVFSGGLKFNRDLVTDPTAPAPDKHEVWQSNHIVPGTLFPIVQFLTRQAGISGIVVGDSHAQGTSTTGEYRNYGYCATAKLLRRRRGKPSFSMVNCALGGLRSETFFARFETLIDAVRPSFAVLPGWTYNDIVAGVPAGEAATELFLARLINAIELCRFNHILPIVLTPLPRDQAAMGPEQVRAWIRLRETLLSMNGDGIVIADATPLLATARGDVFDGTYLPEMSWDHMHPNDAGHAAVGNLLADLIEAHL